MKNFVLTSNKTVAFSLKKGSSVLLNQTYEPGADNTVVIDVKGVVESELSFLLNAEATDYAQPNIAADFTAVIDTQSVSFRVIRCGVANLADTVTNFLKLHFLTWQPKIKKVTYYSPEWLSYYAVVGTTLKLKATFENKSTQTITLASCAVGTARTVNLQYASVCGRLPGAVYPVYFEVWGEASGQKITESQFYAYSDMLSEDEQWFLFENSLGGIDTFRAWGANTLNGEHEYGVAVMGEERTIYNVDTERKYTKNTGHLNDYERRWLLDFFPSRGKYIHEASAIRRIIVTESNVSTVSNELPGAYTFTYQFDSLSAYLNLVKNENELPLNLTIPVPSSPDFSLPPRLAEFPRIELTEGVLFPAFDPYANEVTVTTYGSIRSGIGNYLINQIMPMFSEVYGAIEDVAEMIPSGDGGDGGSGGEGGTGGGINWDLIEAKIQQMLGEFTLILNDRYLRKDIDDTAWGVVSFDNTLRSTVFVQGYNGAGWRITGTGNTWLDLLRVRDLLYIGNGIATEDFISGVAGKGLDIRGYNNTDVGVAVKKWKGEFDNLVVRDYGIFGKGLGSEVFTSGFPNGVGWDLRSYTHLNAAEVEEAKWRLEIDDIIVRGKLRVFEFIVSQLRGENDNVIFAGMMKVDHYDEETKILWLQTDEGVLYNPFREGDILMVQRFGGLPSAENNYNLIKQYELRVTEVGVGNLALGKERLDWIKFSNFVGEIEDVAEGDVLTRVDSVTDSTRKGVVKVTTIDEIGAPYIDVVYGMKTDPEHSVKARLGNLTGIRTKNNADLTGMWGLYAEGAVLENSQIYLNNGLTIEQNFTVMEGNFLSQIDAIREDISEEDGNILRNPGFGSNTYYWDAVNDISVVKANVGLLWVNVAYYANKRKVADIYRDGQRRVLRLRKTRITQSNTYFRFDSGYEKEGTYSFSFFYRAITSGILKAGIPGTELYKEFSVTLSDVYVKYSLVAEWNGTGNFIFETTGEVLIYSVSLFNDALANAVVKLQTQITQNAQEIALRATKQYVDALDGTVREYFEGKFTVTAQQISASVTAINNINNTIQTAGWITSAQGNTLYASKTLESGNTIVSYINQTATDIRIQAAKINLTGQVSFSMLDTNAQGVINAKANSSSLKNLAFEDKVELALLGSSLISGGYIKSSLIDVNNLRVKDTLNIGLFTANSLGITGVLGGDQVTLSPHYVYGESNVGTVSLMISTCSLQLEKTLSLGSTGTTGIFVSGKYLPGLTGQRTIALELIQGAGEDSWFKRTVLRLSVMPFYQHLSALPAVGGSVGSNTYSVKWDARTGILFVE
jgi:hypothetical protein